MIVDASVAVKWFIGEPNSEQASWLFSGPSKLFAPQIIYLEVLSAITKKYRMKIIDRAKAEKAFGYWKEIIEDESVILVDLTSLWDEAFALSLAINHPVADCLYATLSKQKKMPLVTADKVFIEKAKTYYNDLRNLADYSTH